MRIREAARRLRSRATAVIAALTIGAAPLLVAAPASASPLADTDLSISVASVSNGPGGVHTVTFLLRNEGTVPLTERFIINGETNRIEFGLDLDRTDTTCQAVLTVFRCRVTPLLLPAGTAMRVPLVFRALSPCARNCSIVARIANQSDEDENPDRNSSNNEVVVFSELP